MKRFGQLWRRVPAELWLLWAVAALTRLPRLSFPSATVFDEVYFKQFAGAYFTHKYYFDIHPPLGKLLLAGWAKLIGVNPSAITAPPAAGLRWFVALTGMLVVPLVYGIVRRLSGSRLAAGLAGLVVALDGALIVESRFVLVDSLLLVFGLGAIYTALRWQVRPRWGWLAATGLLMGAAVGIKWTGLGPDLVAALILIKGLANQGLNWKGWAIRLLLPLALGAILYLSAFAVHFALLRQTGPGDAFMSPRFQATLQGSPYYDPGIKMNFLAKTWELNREMYNANRTLTAGHPYGSKWYTWPLELRPIYYWEGNVLPNGRQGNIYLLGNPLGWWPASAAALTAMLLLVIPRWRKYLGAAVPAIGLLLFGYLINWLPFAGIARVMFLYHYLFAFVFSVMILAILISRLTPDNRRRWAAVSLIAAVVAGFIFFSPITYGWALSPTQLHSHIWLPRWR